MAEWQEDQPHRAEVKPKLVSDSNIRGRMSAESAEERFIRGFSSKIEGSAEKKGSTVGFIGQEILQHDTKIGFV